jgi:hypothetical protein
LMGRSQPMHQGKTNSGSDRQWSSSQQGSLPIYAAAA